MIKTIAKYLIAIAALTAFSGCSEENPFRPTEESGKLSTARLMLNISNHELQKSIAGTRSNIELADFTIDILQGNNIVRSYRYAEMPGVIELPVGSYSARAHLGNNDAAAWEAPYYEGVTETFEIRKDEITEARTIECRMANVRVSIFYSQELIEHMSADAGVNAVMGDNASLRFTRQETRSGYFAYLQGSHTLAATFDGEVDGVRETASRVYTDVQPGTHYRITYTLHKPGSDPNAEGNIVQGITVDASVEIVDMNINIDPGEGDRPNGGDRPGQGDTPEPPEPPQGQGPTITISDGLSFEAVNDVNASSTVVLTITSETGITAFTVDIVSSTLTPEVLADVNLSDHLDLVNPGNLEEGIAGLGLPVKVGGQKEVEFNISSFMPLLAIYGDNSHKFILKVADASGQVTKILQLHMNP